LGRHAQIVHEFSVCAVPLCFIRNAKQCRRVQRDERLPVSCRDRLASRARYRPEFPRTARAALAPNITVTSGFKNARSRSSHHLQRSIRFSTLARHDLCRVTEKGASLTLCFGGCQLSQRSDCRSIGAFRPSLSHGDANARNNRAPLNAGAARLPSSSWIRRIGRAKDASAAGKGRCRP